MDHITCLEVHVFQLVHDIDDQGHDFIQKAVVLSCASFCMQVLPSQEIRSFVCAQSHGVCTQVTRKTKDGIDLEGVAAQVYVTRFGVQEMLGVITRFAKDFLVGILYANVMNVTSLHFTCLLLFFLDPVICK